MELYGACLGFIIDYIPDEEENFALSLNAANLAKKELELNKRKKDSKIVIFNLPADEKEIGTCGAAGNLLMHINASGGVEPCVFCHISKDNIKEKPLLEILKSEFFEEVRQTIHEAKPFSGKCTICAKDFLSKQRVI